MTGKRYFKRMWEEEYYIFDSQTISESDFEEKLEYQDYKAFEDSMQGDEVIERLNTLNDENKELNEKNRKLNEELRILQIDLCKTKSYEQLEKENKRLKRKLQRERTVSTKQHLKWSKEAEKQIQTLKEENEQLKKELKVYRKLASCSNCKYHNYNWYDDGDEFEVCDKGNDVTDGICEEWEEL